jgi:hypothetical protein
MKLIHLQALDCEVELHLDILNPNMDYVADKILN